MYVRFVGVYICEMSVDIYACHSERRMWDSFGSEKIRLARRDEGLLSAKNTVLIDGI
jgi:hypothetical protein